MASLRSEVVDDEDEDDDYVPPEPVRVDRGVRLDVCPACDKPIKGHGALDLLRCAEAVESDDEDDDRRSYRHHGGGVPASLEAAPLHGPPAPPPSEYDLYQRRKARGEVDVVPPAPPPSPPAPPPPEPVVTEGSTPRRPHVLDPDWSPALVDGHIDEAPAEPAFVPEPSPQEIVDQIAPTVRLGPGELPAGGIVVLPDGSVGLEELAAALRNVIERERDEVVKRGGPIEKQNLELKERLADQIEQTRLWRERCNNAQRSANSYKEQYDNLVRENRKKRAKQDRSGEGAKAVREIKEIKRIVERLPGWTVKMQGNGHYRFEKDGVFVTDAASSGGSQQVNMATIVKLRKAGVKI